MLTAVRGRDLGGRMVWWAMIYPAVAERAGVGYAGGC